MPTAKSKKDIGKPSFLSTMRSLAEAFQAFSNYSDTHIRELGLTPSQFDVVSTLGNTDGMNMKDLAKATLVTKGTLTGIVDRLEKKGIVRREIPPDNRRSFTVLLTDKGETLFNKVFPVHVAYLQTRFERLTTEELQQLRQLLTKLRDQF